MINGLLHRFPPTTARLYCSFDKTQHWNTTYASKPSDRVSWFQSHPGLSLDLIRSVTTKPRSETKIIDVGGGASVLVDFLLDDGFTHITVNDISKNGLEISQQRLGDRAKLVRWLEGDVTDLNSETGPCDIWHDRAVFHFMISTEDQEKYKKVLNAIVPQGGYFIISTFASDGPEKCSGLPVCRYSVDSLRDTFGPSFQLAQSHRYEHPTPFGTVQLFNYVMFKKLN
eukprot:TRINITY_DN1188_c0_g1_i3.p1 TRINITY_DN1188_c0_g1~~TRINITY_DN1188_c0_g1_i3.p1  ORF type:complete len:227 (-),score=22.11 TRINITY_DN1188_c0_g1_i3:95-775(-)